MIAVSALGVLLGGVLILGGIACLENSEIEVGMSASLTGAVFLLLGLKGCGI